MRKGVKSFESEALGEVFATLESSPKGLASSEARHRLAKFGYNEVGEKKASGLVRFIKRFWGSTAWMLETVAVISFLLTQIVNVYLVLALLTLNAVIGFSQESRSGRAVELLRKRLYVNARVMRDGDWVVKPARELVSGDVVFLGIGDVVPADVKIFDGDVLVDQSALTGESLPVEKAKDSVAYTGSIVRKSEAKGVVVATGKKTFFGKTVSLVAMARPESHIEKLIANVVRYIMLIVAIVLVCLLFYSTILGRSLPDILNFMLMLLVSSVPIALPAMLTVTMAVGALKLFRSGVLVTRITAVEDAAIMTTICTDKTGTITENKLSVVEPVAVEGFSKDYLVLLAALATEEASRDPIDIAVMKYAKSKGIKKEGYTINKFTPFDPKTRRTEALIESPDGASARVMKGAPRVLFDIVSLKDGKKATYWQTVEELSAKGFRVIGVAVEKEGELRLAGFIPFYDRPRKDSSRLISELKSLGIDVKMLTGDIAPIAMTVAKEVEIGSGACKIGYTGKKLAREAEKCDIFAEVFPEDKLTIVKSLQSRGRVVGMTGDGVNDAPALKQAEVGTAVKDATDAAKAAASVVLTAEGLSGIVQLVKAGRESFERMYTWIINKIVKTFQLTIFLSVAFFVFGTFITTTSQLILLLFLTDFITISLATDKVTPSNHPEKWDIGKMTKVALAISIIVLLEMSIGLFLALNLFFLSIDQLRTFVFYMLMVTGVTDVLIVRERRSFWSSSPSKPLLAALFVDLAFVTTLCQIGLNEVLLPLPPVAVLVVLLVAIVMILPKDYVKKAALSHESNQENKRKDSRSFDKH
jgi:H+-transporting ATPase